MPATLVWGKDFTRESSTSQVGKDCVEVVPQDGGSIGLSWSSVREAQTAGNAIGIAAEWWPVYPQIELENDLPLDDAKGRSDKMRAILGSVRDSDVPDHHWLKFVVARLREDASFFIMV